MIGWVEIIIVVLFVLVFFGVKRIPEVARALGKASGEFKKAKDEAISDSQKNDDKKESEPKDS